MSDPTLIIVAPAVGRPVRAGTRSSHRVIFRVTPAEHSALRQAASEQQKPMAAMIREAVDEFVADYREQRVFRTN
jgi:predicted HicB family RNase H-like nuclease